MGNLIGGLTVSNLDSTDIAYSDTQTIKDVISDLDNKVAETFGQYLGSASTYNNLPSFNATTGDWAYLTGDDSSYIKGVYTYDGTKFVFSFAPSIDIDTLNLDTAIAGTEETGKLVSAKLLNEYVSDRILTVNQDASIGDRTILTTVLTFYVDSDNGSDQNNGTSRGEAYATLNAVLLEIRRYFLEGGAIRVLIKADNQNLLNSISLYPRDVKGNSGYISFSAYNEPGNSGRKINLASSSICSIRNIENIKFYISGIEFDVGFYGYAILVSNCSFVEISGVKTTNSIFVSYCDQVELNNIDVGIAKRSNNNPSIGFEMSFCNSISLSNLILNYESYLRITNSNNITTKANITIIKARPESEGYSIEYVNCSKLDLGNTIINQDPENANVLLIDSCSGARVTSRFNVNSGLITNSNLRVIKVVNSVFVNFIIYQLSTTKTVTGLNFPFEIDSNSIVRIIDRYGNSINNLNFLPYEGEILVSSGGILNEIDATEVVYEKTISVAEIVNKLKEGYYKSSELRFVNGSLVTFTHNWTDFNITTHNYVPQVWAVCTEAENGWLVGDRVLLNPQDCLLHITNEEILVRISDKGITIMQKNDSLKDFTLNNQRWRIYVQAIHFDLLN